jgi:hypothetical protein
MMNDVFCFAKYEGSFLRSKKQYKTKAEETRVSSAFFLHICPKGKYFTRPKGVFHPTKSDFTRSYGTDFTENAPRFQYPPFFPRNRQSIFLKSSNGKTSKGSAIENASSAGVSGAVRSIEPPRYTNAICTAATASITAAKVRFRPIPENSRSLSVRALKQLYTEAKMKNAKNPVR